MRFVTESLKTPVPWDKLQGQIHLGGEDFIKKHQPSHPIKELPREQTQAYRPELKVEKTGSIGSGILEAYRRDGYRLSEIAKHLNVHYSTVSRRLKRMEKKNA